MNILIVGSFPTPIGGVTRHTSQLYQKLLNEDISTRKLKTNQSYLKLVVEFVKLIFKKPKLVHIHTSENLLVLIFSIFLFKLITNKLIISIHSGNFISKLNTPLNKLIFKLCVYQVNSIIFMNENQSNEIIAKYPFFKNKINYCSPFIFPEFNKMKYHLKKNSLEFNIISMGLWQQLYSYEDVIIELYSLAKKYPNKQFNYNLVISTAVLNLEYKKFIINQINELTISNLNINILENMSNIFEILEKSDLLIRPTNIDSFGICIAESLFVGTPVIATNVCNRAGKSILYSKKNSQELRLLIDNFINNGFSELNNNFLIDDLENGFFQILSNYNKILKN
jgi:glycosyltransferase involved in cell wall biosynthesis